MKFRILRSQPFSSLIDLKRFLYLERANNATNLPNLPTIYANLYIAKKTKQFHAFKLNISSPHIAESANIAKFGWNYQKLLSVCHV